MATGKKLRNLFLFVLSTLLVVAWTSSSWADLPAENVSITCPESVIAGQAINCTSQASPTAGETVTYLWNTDKGEVTVGQGSNTASISSPSVGNSTISINASIPGTANTTAAIGNIAFGGAKPGGWSNPRVHYQLPSAEWPGITGNGNLTKFRWIGTAHSSFKFALLYGGQFKWISPDMSQTTGSQTWTPPAPVPVGSGYILAIITPDGGAPMTAVTAAFGKTYFSAACYGSCQQVGQTPTGFTDCTRSMNYGADFLSSDLPPPIVVTKTASVAVAEPPAPTITSISGPTSTTEGGTEQYAVSTDADDPSTLTFTWDVNGVSYTGSPIDVSFPTPGSYNVSVTVYPTGYPNNSATSTKAVTVAQYPAPTITLSGPETTIEGETERYIATTNSADPTTFTWNVNGVSYSGSTVDLPFPTSGSYSVSVTAYPNAYPNSVSTSTKAVTAAAKVNFTCTESVTTGQPIVCTAQSTPVAGETLTYTWTVNKGAITAGQGTNQVTISSPVVGQTTVSVIVATAPVTSNLFMGNRTLVAGDALAWNNYSKNSSYEAMWSERTNFGGSALAAPAGGGYIKSFRFFAYGHSDFKLAIIRFVSTIGSSYDGNTIIWLSPTITPVYGEMNTWIPAAPVRVEAGDKLAFVVPKNTIPSIARTVENSLKYRSLDAVKNNGTAIQESDYLGFYRDSAATGWVYSAEGVTTLPPDPILLTKTANVTVLDLPTPVITSFNGPITTMEGNTEQYTVTTDAADPATLTFTWDVNGVSYSGSVVNVSFPAAGSYNVTVTAYPTGRPDLAATSTKTVTVAAKVNFTCTESVETGQPISCTAQVVPNGSETLTYLWTVSQGEVTVGQGTNQVTISSPIVGQTTVSLKVTASVPAPTPVTVGFVYSNSSAHTTPLPQNTVTVFANISGNRLPNGSWITSFKYIAGRIKPFRFVLANSLNSSSMELKWISPEITPSAIGENTWAPESPIKVEGSNMYLGYYTYTGDAQTVNYKAVLDGGRERSNATMALGVIETYSKVNWVPSMSAETISELPVPPADYTKTVNVAVMELPAPTITSFDGPTTAMEGNTERYIFTARSSSTLTFEWKVNGISYTGSEMPPLPGLDQAQRLDIDFATPGSYDVKVTVYPTGHPNAATIETKGVTVAQHPAPALTLNGPVSTSEGKTERYTVTIDSEEPMTIAWDINGVSYSGSEIDVPFTTPGSYAVKVTAYPTGYPNSSITRTLTVNAAQYPAPTLTLNGATSTTEGKTEHYTATTDAADPSSVTITWDVNGVSHTGSEIDMPFMAPGNYDLVVTVYPNAYPNSTRTRTLTVLVTQHPIPVIILDGPRTTVEGRTERYTVTTNQTEPMTITWDVNGVYYSGSEVNIAFPTEGSYGVNVTVYPTGYPSSSRTGTLTVVAAKNPAPLITSLDGPRSTTEGNTEQYSITTNAANPATISTVWTINGVEYTGSPVNITFPAAGSYDLSVKVYPTGFPNSSRTGTMPVVVLAVKAPLVGINPPKKGEVNTEMTLSATVKNQSNIETMVMKWTMPDGTIVNSATAKYTPRLEDVGTATFLFTAYPEGYPNSKKEVVVSVPITKYEMPAFTLKPYHKPTGIAPYSVFYAINVALKGSTEKFTYAWDMGDGTAMPAKNKANHTYSAPGEYTVKLTVSDTKGNSQVIEDTVTVTPVMPIIVDSISVKATNKYMKAPVTGMFRPTISGGNPTKDRFATYAWTINGEAVGRNANSMVYKFETPGTFIIGLTVTSKSGLTGTGLQSIEVNPNDPPECTIDYEDIPAKKTTKLVANCTDVDGKIREINWDLGNGKTAKNKTVNYKYAEAGTYTVTLTATDDSKGQTTVSREIVVTR